MQQEGQNRLENMSFRVLECGLILEQQIALCDPVQATIGGDSGTTER